MKRPARVVLFGAVLAAVAACQVIAGIERVEKVDATNAPDGSGSSGTGSSSGVDINDPCGHVLPPKEPESNDPGEELPPFVLATARLSLSKPASNGLGGFDLDLSCTCDSRPGTSQDGGGSCIVPGGGTDKCDSDGGVDNEGMKLFGLLQGQVDLDKDFNDDAASGKRTIMLFIKGWNGQKNDLQVGVGLFVSNGATTSPPPPIEGGTSDWTYPKSISLNGGILQPIFPLPGGYVRDGRLVVPNAGTVTLLLGSNGLTFNESFVVGDLTRNATNNLVTFTGVVGGRIRDVELLAAAGQLRVGGDGDPACDYQGGLIFNGVIKPAICGAVDLPQGKNSDFKGTACDSISSAITLEAYSATISGTTSNDVPPDPEENSCAPAAKGADYYKCN